MVLLSLMVRVALCEALDRRILEEPRLPDGSRAMRLTPADGRVFRALLLHFYNHRLGRCDPGLRALAKAAGVATSTAALSVHRLRRAGWLGWCRKLTYVHGQLRYGRAYNFPADPPELRPRFSAKRESKIKEGLVDKSPRPAAPTLSVDQQIAAARAWAL